MPETAVRELGEQVVLNFGPQHPAAHGVLRLIVTLHGEIIDDLKPDIGYLHRGFEKFGEARTYAQFLPYADRLDYVSSITCGHAFVEAVERLAQIEVPERAQFIRVILAELQRIASHFIFLATFANDLAATTVFLYGFRERELLVDLFEDYCGQRLTYHAFRIGGVPYDLPAGFARKTREVLKTLRVRLDENDRLLTGNRIFRARTEGVGVISARDAIAWGCSGPTLRGSGVDMDVRRAAPYSVYDRLDFDVAVERSCDVLGRYLVRVEEMRQSMRIVEQALDLLPAGPLMAKMPRALKPAPGEARGRVESSRGDMSVYLISEGGEMPCRLRIHAPSFGNLQALPIMSRGQKIGDLVAIIGSIDLVLGDVDR